jgi:hypothetical protein
MPIHTEPLNVLDILRSEICGTDRCPFERSLHGGETVICPSGILI